MTKSQLANRVVLITGAESGIGRATALRCATEGSAIAGIGLDNAALQSLADDLRARGHRIATRVANVADEALLTRAVDELADELGAFDAVFANAGTLTTRTPLADLELDEWNRVLAVDLTGVMLTFRAALPHVPDGSSLLVCGSSLAIRVAAELLPYVAAKAGAHAFARALALELAPRGIRVNVIAPGLTETPMTVAIPGHIEIGLESVPERHLVEIDDIAAMAVHLLSDDARSITGAIVSVDAGRTAS